MALLRILLHGQAIGELQMQKGQEYFAGRGASSHIQLMAERGISRQHLRFAEENGKWRVKLLSKYGEIIYQSQTLKELDLVGSMQFTVAPYDFMFIENPDIREIEVPSFGKDMSGTGTIPVPTTPATTAPNVTAAPTFDNARALAVEGQSSAPKTDPSIELQNTQPGGQRVQHETIIAEPNTSTGSGTKSITGRTIVATSPHLSAFLKIVNNKTKTEEVLKLEGNLWSVGRHPKCEILLNDTAISRKHFDITRTEKGYYVIDHGSSNGTRVNGEKIPSGQPHPLISGDVLTIRHIEIKFEVHDSSYDNRMLVVPTDFEEMGGSSFSAPAMIEAGAPPSDSQLMLNPGMRSGGGRIKIYRKKKNIGVRVLVGVLVCIILYGLFSPSPKPIAPPATADGKTDNASMPKNLTPQQEQEATDVYNLGKNYYLQKKYVLCLSQFEKLHALVPLYKDSKQIEGYCSQGKELEQIEADRERKEREKQDVENKIRAIVEECHTRSADISSSAEMTNCLQPAIELDPSNGAVNEMISQMKVKENLVQTEQQKLMNFNKRKHEGEELYQRAVAAFRAGELKKAASLFAKFTAGHYPGLNQQEDKAGRDIASIKKTLADQLTVALSSCQSSLDKGDSKAAVLFCEKVLHENANDTRAHELYDKAYSQLKHEMKSIYEDSVLEESLGNIESAKEKWAKIIDKDIPDDEYCKKAKSKLRKYGIGM
jgi:tetratricopeptide (TPR) repeat protein